MSADRVVQCLQKKEEEEARDTVRSFIDQLVNYLKSWCCGEEIVFDYEAETVEIKGIPLVFRSGYLYGGQWSAGQFYAFWRQRYKLGPFTWVMWRKRVLYYRRDDFMRLMKHLVKIKDKVVHE